MEGELRLDLKVEDDGEDDTEVYKSCPKKIAEAKITITFTSSIA